MPENQTYSKGTIYKIKLEELLPDPNQPRKYIDEEALEELMKSIKQHDVLVPILFRVDENGQKVIVAGERRYQASKRNELKDIPALFVDGKHAEIALVENLLRQNLTPMEEAEALQEMKVKFSYSDTQLSRVLSKGRSTISEILSMNRLPEEIRAECRKSFQIPRDKLIEIARLDKPEEMKELYERVKKENLTRAEIRKLKNVLVEEKPEAADNKEKDVEEDKSIIEVYADKIIGIIQNQDGRLSANEKKKLNKLVKEIQNVLLQ